MDNKNHKPLPKLSPSDILRFQTYTNRHSEDECWTWERKRTYRGYGQFAVGTRWYSASRMAYFIAFGVDPADKQVCHRCDNPPCVNPKHLFLGTQKENLDDMYRKGRRRSVSMKPYTPRGEDSPHSKLTEHDVMTIRRRYAVGGISQKALGLQYGVCTQTINEIIRGDIWNHLPLEHNPGKFRVGVNAPKGESHGESKLTEQQVREIRSRYQQGGVSMRQLGLDYGICPQTICDIVHRKIWKHI